MGKFILGFITAIILVMWYADSIDIPEYVIIHRCIDTENPNKINRLYTRT